MFAKIFFISIFVQVQLQFNESTLQLIPETPFVEKVSNSNVVDKNDTSWIDTLPTPSSPLIVRVMSFSIIESVQMIQMITTHEYAPKSRPIEMMVYEIPLKFMDDERIPISDETLIRESFIQPLIKRFFIHYPCVVRADCRMISKCLSEPNSDNPMTTCLIFDSNYSLISAYTLQNNNDVDQVYTFFNGYFPPRFEEDTWHGRQIVAKGYGTKQWSTRCTHVEEAPSYSAAHLSSYENRIFYSIIHSMAIKFLVLNPISSYNGSEMKWYFNQKVLEMFWTCYYGNPKEQMIYSSTLGCGEPSFDWTNYVTGYVSNKTIYAFSNDNQVLIVDSQLFLSLNTYSPVRYTMITLDQFFKRKPIITTTKTTSTTTEKDENSSKPTTKRFDISIIYFAVIPTVLLILFILIMLLLIYLCCECTVTTNSYPIIVESSLPTETPNFNVQQQTKKGSSIMFADGETVPEYSADSGNRASILKAIDTSNVRTRSSLDKSLRKRKVNTGSKIDKSSKSTKTKSTKIKSMKTKLSKMPSKGGKLSKKSKHSSTKSPLDMLSLGKQSTNQMGQDQSATVPESFHSTKAISAAMPMARDTTSINPVSQNNQSINKSSKHKNSSHKQTLNKKFNASSKVAKSAKASNYGSSYQGNSATFSDAFSTSKKTPAVSAAFSSKKNSPKNVSSKQIPQQQQVQQGNSFNSTKAISAAIPLTKPFSTKISGAAGGGGGGGRGGMSSSSKRPTSYSQKSKKSAKLNSSYSKKKK
ncbi:hypothetical protein BLOT_015885 [Blomia tropicalis]|nr:hypothetical protein BLOT_015885 [Blomia tropicalis]